MKFTFWICIYFHYIFTIAETLCPHNIKDHAVYKVGGEEICYWKNTQKMEAHRADVECRKYGGRLAHIPNEEAQKVVSIFLSTERTIFQAFIGVNDRKQNGVYETIEGQKQTWFYWATEEGQPDNEEELKCVIIAGKDHKWRDVNCSFAKESLCSTQTKTDDFREFNFEKSSQTRGQVGMSVVVRSVTECATECATTGQCNGFLFDKNNQKCTILIPGGHATYSNVHVHMYDKHM